MFEQQDDSNVEIEKDMDKNEIFKMNTFASPTQNLTGLQEMGRSCNFDAEVSHNADLEKLVRKLVIVAAEGKY